MIIGKGGEETRTTESGRARTRRQWRRRWIRKQTGSNRQRILRCFLWILLAAELGFGIRQTMDINWRKGPFIVMSSEQTEESQGDGAMPREVWGIRFQDGGLEFYREEQYPVIGSY